MDMNSTKNQKVGKRLVTQNLVYSAVQSEVKSSVTVETIEDLSALINVIVMYDEIIFLDRTWLYNFVQMKTDLTEYLKDIVKIDYPSEKQVDGICQVAQKHLLTLLGDEVKTIFPYLTRVWFEH